MEKIPVIAFEGVNRVGKGTQIELLVKELKLLDINSITLRGDGTRNGDGLHDGDPYNDWWIKNANKIRLSDGTEKWDIAAEKLMMEFIDWRQKAFRLNKEIILLDRSLISRAAFVIDRGDESVDFLDINILYPNNNNNNITIEKILPDLIIELLAPQDVLYSRLDKKDPKYEFRKSIIKKGYQSFIDAESKLPEKIKKRIVKVDSSKAIDLVFDDVLEAINKRIEILKKIK